MNLSVHKIAILALDDVVVADLANAYELFHHVELENGHHPYEIFVCGHQRIVHSAGFDLQLKWSLEQLEDADTVIVPGVTNIAAEPSGEVVDSLLKALSQGARVASVCTGAFVLAACGILNGKKATTHWKVAGLLSQLYPNIQVLPNVLFTDNGQVLTSAGATAGLDLCLHLIKRDHGAAVAAHAAKLAVVPLERTGDQAQFILRPAIYVASSLAPLLQWIEERLDQAVTLQQMAQFASISVRTLNRRFLEQLQMSPNKWLIQARVKAAQYILETTSLSIEQVATKVGFNSGTLLREHFAKHLGVSPSQYRNSFKGK